MVERKRGEIGRYARSGPDMAERKRGQRTFPRHEMQTLAAAVAVSAHPSLRRSLLACGAGPDSIEFCARDSAPRCPVIPPASREEAWARTLARSI
eukprot:3602596-Rhodomonas_salina.1